MKKIKIGVLFCLIFSVVSCVKDIDFNQANQLELQPTYVASLLTFDLKQTSLFNLVTNTEIVTIENTYSFSFTRDVNIEKKVQKIVLNFQFNNPFNRNFEVEYLFFDTNNIATYKTLIINVPANSANFKHQEEILISSNPNLLKTEQMHSKIRLLPSTDNSVINVNEAKSFNFKLAGTFYLKVTF